MTVAKIAHGDRKDDNKRLILIPDAINKARYSFKIAGLVMSLSLNNQGDRSV